MRRDRRRRGHVIYLFYYFSMFLQINNNKDLPILFYLADY